ncbi:hypothetical protein EsH8_V_001098 [Colletotrichum jinshuiense]
MKRSGFHRWGFVIYRVTYDDDAMWECYFEVLKLSARDVLVNEGGDVLLEQYMDWPVISDRATLDGASKADVRRHFKSWCAARSEERDSPGATRFRVRRLPRLKHCIYVNRKCLDTVAELPADYTEALGELPQSNVVVVVIDGAFKERIPGDDQGYPDVEGCTESGIDYKRPPLISPTGF